MTKTKPTVEERLDRIEAHLGLHDTNTDAIQVAEDEPEPEAAPAADEAQG